MRWTKEQEGFLWQPTSDGFTKMELKDVLRIIRANLSVVFVITVAAVTITAFITYTVVPREYQATATLVVNTPTTNPLSYYQDVMGDQQLVKTYGEIVKSRAVLSSVINQLHIDMTVSQLAQGLNVNIVNDSQVMSLTVTHKDPSIAAQLANTIASTFKAQVASIMATDNVKIIDKAVVPEQPASPKPLVNMSLAFILGLVLSVGIALIRARFDATLKEEADTELFLGLPVLAVVDAMNAPGKSN